MGNRSFTRRFPHVKFVAVSHTILTDPRTRAAYAEAAGIYRIVPAGVAIAEDVTELVALIQWAAGTRTPLIPRGAGSGMPGGNVGPGVIVDLSAGGGFADLTIDPHAGTAHAGAAVTCSEVNDAAKPYGLRLPPDPSSALFATCGGMVATNAAGPRTVRYGSARRWVRVVARRCRFRSARIVEALRLAPPRRAAAPAPSQPRPRRTPPRSRPPHRSRARPSPR